MASNYTRYVDYTLQELKCFAQRDETALSAKKILEKFTIDRILRSLGLSRNDKNIAIAEWLQKLFKEKLLEFRKDREYIL